MNGPLPFEDLFERLVLAGIDVGPRDRVALETLIARYDGTSRDEFRDAVAALLAGDEEQIRRIRRVFDEFYTLAEERPPPPPPPPPPPTFWERTFTYVRRNAPWLVVLLVGSVGVGVFFRGESDDFWCWLVRCEGIQKAESISSALSSAESKAISWMKGDDEPQKPDPTAPPSEWGIAPAASRPSSCPDEPKIRQWPRPTAILGAAMLAALVGLSFFRGARRARSERRTRRLTEFMDLAGRRLYAADVRAESTSQWPMDEMVSMLADALRRATPSREIDVDRTVERTAHSGLAPKIVRRTRNRPVRALVLVDVGPASHAFARKVEAFMAALDRRGFAMEVLHFEGDPTRVSVRPRGRLQPLSSFAAASAGLPLVVVGVGEMVARASYDDETPLKGAFSAWPTRVLLSPLENLALWPPYLDDARATLPAFPMNLAGIRMAAQVLADPHTNARALERWRLPRRAPLRSQDADRIRAMVAIAPPLLRSWDLVEALRARFFPEAPEEIVLAASPVIDEDDDALEIRRTAEAIELLRRSGKPDEAEVRAFFVEVLEKNRPEEAEKHAASPGEAEPAAVLRWRRDHALQKLHGDEEDRAEALRTLEALAGGPLGVELEKDLDTRRGAANRSADLGLVAKALRAAGRVDVRHFRPVLRGRDVAIVMGLSALFGGVAAALGAFSSVPVALDGGSQLLFGDDDVRAALCSVAGFHDVRTRASEISVLGAPRGKPGSNDELSFVFMRVTDGPLSFVRSLQSWKVSISTSALRVDFPTAAPSFAVVRYWGTQRARIDVRAFDPSNKLWRSGEKELEAAVGEPDPVDYFASVKSRFELEMEQCAHSSGVLPGTGEEILARLLGAEGARCENLPRCDQGEVLCGGECAALETDAANCGKCGHPCEKGQKCAAGQCVDDCPEGRRLCGGDCVLVESDPKHCGTCGNACSAGLTCLRGQCGIECPAGKLLCGKTCISPDDDVNHCGGCDKPCSQWQKCVSGQCVSPVNKKEKLSGPVPPPDDGPVGSCPFGVAPDGTCRSAPVETKTVVPDSKGAKYKTK